ncbi:PsiF family protein [Teichococcus vastitatis]|uniref:PsiF family protein n=1 Tax=Teichococcus vastitatis TaxID=2307076 RepID=A0ABS9WBS1_9PROT|nr:PsiF family protein [Pseudoroseomonas vastitatis]MCI0756754.1 PsiF family protein [Pseudoroseomonas vastitatis]
MKSLLPATLCLFLAVPALAPAAESAGTQAAAATRPVRTPSPAQLAARERMRDCAATARSQKLSGDPRKAFMKTCLVKR